MTNIYGVDTEKPVTAEQVKEAIIKCFFEAHCSQSDLDINDDSLNSDYCVQIVEKAFDETDGDFDHPSKNSLQAVIEWLADFSKSFRDQDLIKRHFGDIQKLVDRLGDNQE